MNRTEIYRNIAFENGKQFPWNPDEYRYLKYKTVKQLDDSMSNCFKSAAVESAILDNLIIEINDYELLAGRMAISFKLDKEKAKVIEEGVALEEARGYDCGWKNSQTNHRTVDYEKVLHKGIKGIIREIDEHMQKNINTEFYKASKHSLEAVCRLAKRYNVFLQQKAEKEHNSKRKTELLEMAKIFSNIPYNPCVHFYEALQCVWFIQFCLKAVDDISITGRPDNYLYPYYKRDIESGYITKEFAFELIEQFFFKHNEIYNSWPCAVMVGGVDRDGNYVCNELTYMMIRAIKTVKLVNPSVAIAYTDNMPDELLNAAIECIAEGYTRPAFFNDRIIQKGLADAGVNARDSRYYIHSSCVEITPIASSDVLVATPYINLNNVFGYILTDKKVPYKIGKVQGVTVGWGGWGVHTMSHDINFNTAGIENFEEFYELVKKVISSTLEAHIESAYELAKNREKASSPLSSALIDNCLKRGLDCGNGGAKYDYIYPCFPGFANLVDGIAAIKKSVFEEKVITLSELGEQCLNNFDNAYIRAYILNKCSKFGNDDDKVDSIAKDLYDFIYEELQRLSKGKNRKVYPSYFAWISHGIMGEETMSTPDGRKNGEAFSEHLGAVQGRDKNGPGAVINSIAKLDQSKGIGGIATNFKFSKTFMKTREGKEAVKSLIKFFMASDCFECQFNVIGNDELLLAQKHPENYQNLLVRVAGYSDYFVRLKKNVQDEIIKRSEYGL